MGQDSYKGELNDIVITLLGATGCGKTNFINTFTGGAEQPGASSLKLDTKGVTPHLITYANHRLVLVDTPGFDDASQPDTEVLMNVSDWLKQKYPEDPTLKASGVIYFHRITDNRMSGSVYKNIHTFVRLCGYVPLHRVRLVTTMWDKAKDPAVAENRETQLKGDFWPTLLEEGAIARRFDNTQTCALDIVRELTDLGEGGRQDQQKNLNRMDSDESAGCFRAVLSAMRAHT